MASVSSTSSSSSTNRITGLVTELDTDTIVEGLVSGQQSKIDKMTQKIQDLEWKQEAYRTIITKLQTFQNTYFDTINSTNNLKLSSTFSKIAATATVNGSSTSAVTVSAKSTASTTNHTLSNITLAKTDKWSGSNAASMVGSGADYGAISSGDQVNVTLDGTTKTITLTGGYGSLSDLSQDLQDKLDLAFGAGAVAVSSTSGELSFSSEGHVFSISNTNSEDTVVASLGFASGDSNVLNTSATLGDANFASDIFGGGSTIAFTINGVSFSFDKDSDTVSDIISAVNNSSAGVRLSYSQLSNGFVLESKNTGAASAITFSDTTGSFASTFFTNHVQTASDSQFTLDGVTTTRSSNSFTIDGVSYTLNSATSDTINISVAKDTSGIKDLITQFVEDYNELMTAMNDAINEEVYEDYDPLTDAQREELTDEQIEKWEAKAKSGELNNDTYIKSIMSKFRNIILSTQTSGGLSLIDLGITTTEDYTNGGLLTIDEDTLEEAIAAYGDEIGTLFADDSSGIAAKMDEVLDDNIKTVGTKGVLITLAGLDNTSSEDDNSISDQIEELEEDKEEAEEKLEDLKEYYYAKFTAMENYISQMNTQISYISSWLG